MIQLFPFSAYHVPAAQLTNLTSILNGKLGGKNSVWFAIGLLNITRFSLMSQTHRLFATSAVTISIHDIRDTEYV